MAKLDSFGRGLVITLIATSAWVAVPRSTQACSLADGLWNAEPAPGAALPFGSRLFLSGYFELSTIVVAVDGTPATLVLDAGLPGRGDYGAAYRIEPMPPEGATVTLYECYADPSAECEPPADIWSWVVGAADTTTPEAAGGLEFGIYDHADLDTSGDSCSNGEILDVTIYAHVDIAAEDGSGAVRQASIEVVDAEDGAVLASRLVDLEPAGGRLDPVISFEAGELSEPLDASVCMRVTVLDLAGNLAEAASSCEPHHAVADADQGVVVDWEPPAEPDWEAWEEPSTADPLESGCACRTDSRPSGLAGSLWLGLLGLGLRGRWRRARRGAGRDGAPRDEATG